MDWNYVTSQYSVLRVRTSESIHVMLECAAAFSGCVMSDVLSKEVVPQFLTYDSKQPFNKRTELTRGAAGELLNTEITVSL